MLERTLESLSTQDVEVPYEVVVVASGTETVTVARKHRVVDQTLVDDTACGPGNARNVGVDASCGDIILFTDADTVVPASWIRSHYRHYTVTDVIGVGGPLRPYEGRVTDRLAFRVLSDWWYRVSWPFGFVQQPGCNCSVRRRAFERVDGFDASLDFLEDTDLSLRLSNRGTVVYDPTAPVYTSPRRQNREGYLGLGVAYAIGYLEYWLPGHEPTRNHFNQW